MIYNELTRRHFDTAENAGVLSGPGTCRGAAGSRALGTWVQFDLQWDGEVSGRRSTLHAARFLAFGCPHVIAVANWITQQAVGSHRETLQAARALPESVASLRQRFAVPTEKTGRLLIVEDAWIAASLAPSP